MFVFFFKSQQGTSGRLRNLLHYVWPYHIIKQLAIKLLSVIKWKWKNYMSSLQGRTIRSYLKWYLKCNSLSTQDVSLPPGESYSLFSGRSRSKQWIRQRPSFIPTPFVAWGRPSWKTSSHLVKSEWISILENGFRTGRSARLTTRGLTSCHLHVQVEPSYNKSHHLSTEYLAIILRITKMNFPLMFVSLRCWTREKHWIHFSWSWRLRIQIKRWTPVHSPIYSIKHFIIKGYFY